MSLSQIPLPSFSLVLTCDSPDGLGPPVELLAMKDWTHASRREVHLNLQPQDNDPLMKTVDTRFVGSVAYDVVYSDGKSRSTHHQNSASASSSSASTADAHIDSDSESVELNTVFEDGESQFGVCELGKACPPLHRPPPLAPHYEFPNAIPLRVVGRANTRGGPTSASPQSNRRRSTKPTSRFAGLKVLFDILKFFRSIWRKLKKAGGMVGRMCRLGSNMSTN